MAVSTGSKIFGVLLLLLAGAVVVGLVVFNQSGSSASEGEPVVVEIPEGLGAASVADLLEDEGVIRSALVFKLFARLDARADNIQAGTYELRTGMSISDVLSVLSAGPPPVPTFRVTIPEGLTVAQTLERIAGANGSPFTVDELREALAVTALPSWVPLEELPEDAEPFEGLLFPETYEFVVEADPQEVLGRLVAQTEQVMAGVTPPEGFDRYELLIVASLIEREARLADERPTIASVIYNRLAVPMRLQIDATVLYARGEHTERVLEEDLEIDSPWNTYRVDGLPPTPIAGAGRSAIEAAANPADTDYLFYVVSDPDTGAHAFAETKEEHDANVAEFRRRREEAEAGATPTP